VIQTFRKILTLLSRSEKRKYLLLGLANTMTSLLDLAGVLFSGFAGVIAYSYFSSAPMPVAVEKVISSSPFSQFSLRTQLIISGVSIIILFLAKSFLGLILSYRNLQFLRKLAVVYSLKMYRDFAKKTYYEIRKLSRDPFSFALTDGVLQIFIGMLGSYITVFAEVFFLCLVLAVMFIIDPIIAVILIGVFGFLTFFSNRLVSKRIISSGNENVTRSIEGKRIASETKVLFRELNLSGEFLSFSQKYELNRSKASSAVMKMNFLQLFPKYFLEFITVLLGVILLVGTGNNEGASIAAGKVSIYVAAMVRLVPSLLRIQTALVSIQSGLGGVETTLAVFKTIPSQEIRNPENGNHSSATQPSGVIVRELSFKFPDEDTYLFEGISLDLPSSTMTALVGMSGSGKSTLMDLILGFTESTSGVVLIDGLPVHKYIAENPGAIAIIPQEIVLIDGTLEQNIALGVSSDQVDHARIGFAIKGATLEGMLEVLPLGLQTQVEENGARFSGGQRQRIVIARALYTNPKYIFLDEPTSALDEETEKSFVSMLEILKLNSTLLVISHRKASLAIADQCYVLEGGKLNFLDNENQSAKVIKFLEESNEIF
jgi:ABC-type multidrug transport system fused ATPase/permease subunit